MKQTEIARLREVRVFLKTQLLEPQAERSMSELARNLGLKSAFSHYGAERLWAMINEAVQVFDEDFRSNRHTGVVSRREPPWWSVWRCQPMTAAGRSGAALEAKEA